MKYAAIAIVVAIVGAGLLLFVAIVLGACGLAAHDPDPGRHKDCD